MICNIHLTAAKQSPLGLMLRVDITLTWPKRVHHIRTFTCRCRCISCTNQLIHQYSQKVQYAYRGMKVEEGFLYHINQPVINKGGDTDAPTTRQLTFRLVTRPRAGRRQLTDQSIFVIWGLTASPAPKNVVYNCTMYDHAPTLRLTTDN